MLTYKEKKGLAMRGMYDIVAFFFGFSLLMLLFLIGFHNLGLIDLSVLEFIVISAFTGLLLDICYFYDTFGE